MDTVVNFNIDTWILNVKGTLRQDIADELEHLRELAQEQEHDIPTSWSYRGQTFFIKPHGSRGQWRWILSTPEVHLEIGKGKLNGIIGKVRLSSLLLHADGPDVVLVNLAIFLENLFGRGIEWQVSEVHLCADIAGWQLTLEDTMRFVTRSRTKAIYFDAGNDAGEAATVLPVIHLQGKRLQDLKFSQSAPHSCDIYNKTKEVQDHHKEWFHEVWRRNGWDGETPVMRVEFRYERECLREMGIEDPFEMIERIPEMWAYSSQKWLRHTVPCEDTNQTRWAISEAWQVVQGASGFIDATPIVRQKKIELDAERAKAGFVGYATSWAVRSGLPLTAIQEDGGGFIAWAFDPVQDYLHERKEATFVEVMQEKALKLGIPLKAA